MGNRSAPRRSLVGIIITILIVGLSQTTIWAQDPTATSVFDFGGELPTPDIVLTPDYANPTPTAPNFSEDPDYQSPPTPIPSITLPDVPTFSIYAPGAGLSTPELPNNSLPTPAATLVPIDTAFTLTYRSPVSISMSVTDEISEASETAIETIMSGQSVISGVLSNTNALSATYMGIWDQTDELITESAPDWYAPTLPRPLADIGWRFERMGEDVRRRYSLTAWGTLAAEIIALPLRMVKGLRELASLLGPFGLFLTWLLIMLPVTMFFKILEFLKGLILGLWNFAVQVAHIIMDLIELIPGE